MMMMMMMMLMITTVVVVSKVRKDDSRIATGKIKMLGLDSTIKVMEEGGCQRRGGMKGFSHFS